MTDNNTDTTTYNIILPPTSPVIATAVLSTTTLIFLAITVLLVITMTVYGCHMRKKITDLEVSFPLKVYDLRTLMIKSHKVFFCLFFVTEYC